MHELFAQPNNFNDDSIILSAVEKLFMIKSLRKNSIILIKTCNICQLICFSNNWYYNIA